MRKWELAVAAILALLLGGGLVFVFNDFSRTNEVYSSELTGVPPTIYIAEVTQTSIPYLSTPTPESSKEMDIVSPTLVPIKVGEEESPDMEDLLLLYSSEHPGAFDFNYCQVGEFYGLICKKVDLEKIEITDELLRDGFGKYFKLIGLDAALLQQEPALLSKGEIDILKNAIEIYRSNLLIYNLNDKTASSNLKKLANGALLKITVPQDSHRDWFVSTNAPEITQEFTGQVITSTTSASQIDFALNLDPKATITPLISSKDDNGANYFIFARLFQGSGSIFLSAGAPGWGLDTRSFRDIYYSPSHFSEIIPLMLTIRYTLGEEAWHNDHNYANLTIDDPSLTEPFQRLNYKELLKEMDVHHFHTTIAFPPRYWENSDPEVVSLFIKHPERYSIVQHGNNHDGWEFYKYTVSSGDQFPARSLADQEWDILEGLSRMDMFHKYTGIPFDRVMVFPYGISPEPTLVLLKKNNYLATVNAMDIPLDATPSLSWEEGMLPVSLSYGNFPVIYRRTLYPYKPFRPNIQPFLFDLFIDKSALMYSHAKDDELFAGGINAFDPVADKLNQIPGGVVWLSLGELIKHLHLEKVNDDGSVNVRMFTRDLILTNDYGGERVYHISKEETLNVPIMNLTVNGQEFPYRLEGGFLTIDVVIPERDSLEIIIQYQDK